MLERKFIITGAAGSGKTSLIQTLRESGYVCATDVTRKLFGCLPAKESDKISLLADEALNSMIQLYNEAPQHQTSFFDCGIPDLLGCLQFASLPVDKRFCEAVRSHRYSRSVFLLPPWKEIYMHTVQQQSFEEAIALYEEMKKAYNSSCYAIVELPFVSVQKRANSVIELVKELN